MGYYSYLRIVDMDIKDKQGLRGLLSEIKMKVAADIAPDWMCELDLLSLKEDGRLTYPTDECKWYHVESWLTAISPFVNNCTVVLIGEDYEKWGFIIDKGKLYRADFFLYKTKSSFLKPEDLSQLKG
jgi:hypothetical protein